MDSNQESKIETLPFDLMMNIFGWCELPDILSCLQTCTHFKQLAKLEHQKFWCPIFEHFYFSGPQIFLHTQNQNYFAEIRERYLHDLKWNYICSNDDLDIRITKQTRDLAKMQTISCCVSIDDNHVLWGTSEGALMVKDLTGNQIGSTITVHCSIIWAVQKIGNRIYTNSNSDPVIGVFDLNEKYELNPVQLLNGPFGSNASVWDCALVGNQIIGGSGVGTIYLWDLEKNQLIRSFDTAKGGIFSMDVCGDKIIVGSTSGVLSSWDFEGNKIGSVQVGLEQADLIRGIQSVDPVNGIVLTAQQNGSIRCWDVNEMKELWGIKETNQDQMLNEFYVFGHQILCTGLSVDSTWVKIIDFKSKKSIAGFDIDLRCGRIYSIHCRPGVISIAAGSNEIIITNEPKQHKEGKKSKKLAKNAKSEKCVIS